MGLLERLAQGPVLCAEGYLFEIERRGFLQAGAYVPEVVLEHPELVEGLHRDFVRAGSDADRPSPCCVRSAEHGTLPVADFHTYAATYASGIRWGKDDASRGMCALADLLDCIEQVAQVFCGHGEGNAGWVRQCAFLRTFDENHVDHPDHFARAHVVQRTATAAWIGGCIKLEHVEYTFL